MEELLDDLRLLQHRQPDLFEDAVLMLDGVEWADSETVYSNDETADSIAPIADGEPLDPRTDIEEHGQSGGCSWSYTGAGSQQLALAILAHATDPGVARRRAQGFAAVYIQSLDDGWKLTAEEVQKWVRIVENEDRGSQPGKIGYVPLRAKAQSGTRHLRKRDRGV